MKERPILFSAPMVRAILEGRKTQTRRVVKPQPLAPPARYADHGLGWQPESNSGKVGIFGVAPVKCPYGAPGDRLWVRETFFQVAALNDEALLATEDSDFLYRADYSPLEEGRVVAGRHAWKPSIFMPRYASRITLEVTVVKVERLNDISEEDAIGEGAARNDAPGEEWDGTYLTPGYMAGIEGSQDDEPCYSAREWFRSLWHSINGPGSWEANPWVWVVEFRRIKP